MKQQSSEPKKRSRRPVSLSRSPSRLRPDMAHRRARLRREGAIHRSLIMAMRPAATDEDQDTIEQSLQHRPHYDVREASKNYSNIASVLAGFAFAAVILVVQSIVPANAPKAIALRDLASIAFLLAFFGCIVSAFIFSVVAGEEELAPRSHSMAFLGGSGFALSAIYMFWGLATLIEVFLSPEVLIAAYLILGGFIMLCPVFLIMSWFDVPMAFKEAPTIIGPRTWTILIVAGYAPLVLGIALRVFAFRGLDTFASTAYFITALISFVLILVGAVLTLRLSNAEYRAHVGLSLGAIWIGIHSCLFAVLIALLP